MFKFNNIKLISFFLITSPFFFGCESHSQSTKEEVKTNNLNPLVPKFIIINYDKNTLSERFSPPEGYVRKYNSGYAAYLQALPLKRIKTKSWGLSINFG